MYTILAIFQVFLCFFLILVVLLQSGKGADMGAAFGGGSTQTMFGARGAQTFIGKLTTITAILFMGNSILLAYLSSSSNNEFKNLEEREKKVVNEVVDRGGEKTAETKKQVQGEASQAKGQDMAQETKGSGGKESNKENITTPAKEKAPVMESSTKKTDANQAKKNNLSKPAVKQGDKPVKKPAKK
ncbi:MAG: preprotein translocase subunit SecG [Deltaproteobacteria bacterium]|nr:preprotein translocase subunit SecG [Deltaproteobacteria bacterium]